MTDGPAGRPLVSKMLRFGVVGIANSLIDLAIFSALLWFAVTPLLANLLAWFGAVCFSYCANSRWSFERAGNLGSRRSVFRLDGDTRLVLGWRDPLRADRDFRLLPAGHHERGKSR